MTNDTLYIETSQAPVFNVGGALVQFLASEVPFQEETLDVLIGVLLQDVFVPLHSHNGPEWFYILAGEMEAYIGDENGGDWKIVRTGELVVVPGSLRHAWKHRSNAPSYKNSRKLRPEAETGSPPRKKTRPSA